MAGREGDLAAKHYAVREGLPRCVAVGGCSFTGPTSG